MLDEYGDVLTLDEVRQILKVGRNSAYDAIKSGLVPSFRVGRQIRVMKSSLMEALTYGLHKAEDAG